MNEHEPHTPHEEIREALDDPRLAEDLRQWAAAPLDAPPVDRAALAAAIDEEEALVRELPTRRESRVPRLAWTMAAAALLVFALSNVGFTVRWGETEWRWGQAPPPQVAAAAELSPERLAQLDRFEASLNAVAVALADHEDWLAALTESDQQQRVAAARTRDQLLQWQRIESATRYEDVDRLISMLLDQSAALGELREIAAANTNTNVNAD